MPKKSNVKRADGRIAVQVYLGKENGKRKYKTVYGATQKEADDKANDIRLKMHKGFVIANKADTFEVWANYYLDSKKVEVSNNQYNLIKTRVNYWISVFGNISLIDIKPINIQQSINELSNNNPYTGKPSAKLDVY